VAKAKVTRGARMLVASAAVSLAVAGCGGSGKSNATGSTRTTHAATTSSEASTATTPVTEPSEDSTADGPTLHLTAFTSPSHNIGCQIFAEEARCDAAEYDWPSLPPKPADCDTDWGGALAVESTGRGFVVCHGDTALGATDVLPYGATSEAEGYTCVSRPDGVQCTNDATHHGFVIARGSYRVY
jgi:hypothetical protein